MSKFVSRAGEKLEFALKHFDISVHDKIVADFGSATGGFVDCLLQNGARRVYAIEVAHGQLDWKLRNNNRVIVLEKTNAMHVEFAEEMDLISIDVGWTKLFYVLPRAFANLKHDGKIIALIKPHYEAERKFIKKGRLKEEKIKEVLEKVKEDIKIAGGRVLGIVESPLVGARAKNREFLALIVDSN